MTKKTILIIAVCLIGLGCNKLKGERGDKGDPGPGRVYIVTGFLTSNETVVNNFTIRTPANIAVYLADGLGDKVELPYFLPDFGYNAYAVISTGRVDIYNGILAGADRFEIIIVTQ